MYTSDETMWSIVLISSLLAFSASGQNLDVPTVVISQGIVYGSASSDYYEFHGIPYADSTSGSHRFKAPSPPPLFTEPFTADRKNIKCVRALGIGYEGTEDCLVANVFTPSLNTASELPVMVWIKGKQFDNIYEPELTFKNFMEQDVVVVSLNFRESILGFLCLGTETAPGNAGLKDIIAGLQWVKENIREFGGDPNSITLFGHGSGAAAVDLVTLSPMANGFVNKAIVQSGSALAPWAVSRDNLKHAIEVAEALGHVVTDIETLSEVFTRTSVAALMGIINELDLTDNSLAFSPCIENEALEGAEPFLIESPYQTINNGEFMQIPFMTGFVQFEGTIRAEEALRNEDNWLHRMETSFADFLQQDLRFETDEQEEHVAQLIKSYYFGDEPINEENIDDYLLYHGDTMISVSVVREVKMRATSATEAIYLYMFSYKGSLGEPFEGLLEVNGAAHSEELGYLFSETTTSELNDDDLEISKILIERWINFAKTGTPTSETSNVTWVQWTDDDNYFIQIVNGDDAAEVSLVGPKNETLSFWEEIYEEHFIDASGRWNLERDDEGEESGEGEEGDGSEEGEGDEDTGNGNGEDNEGSGDGNGETVEVVDSFESEEDEDGSAATAVGYTFSIITLFAILSKFHSSQILS